MSTSSSGNNQQLTKGADFLKDKYKQNPGIIIVWGLLTLMVLFWILSQIGNMVGGSNATEAPKETAGMHKSTSVMGKSGGQKLTAHAQSISPALVKEGEAVFKTNCQVCHQADAVGKPGVAPSLVNPELLSLGSDKFFMSTIRDGREGTAMAPYAHLGRSKIKALVGYLRSHATRANMADKVDSQPDAHGDARLGKQWYDGICSTCHGLAGNGYMAGGTGTAIGGKGFLNKVTDGFIRETIKYGRSNTRMLGFQGSTAMANLNNQEIDDIIVYLRTLAK